jgi:hypothetical protein
VNEQLQSMVADSLQKLINGIQQGGQIVAVNFPILVKQYLMWKGGEDVLVLILCLIFGTISYFAFRRYHKKEASCYTWLEGIFNKWEMVIPATIITFSIVFSCIAIFDLLEITLAPGVYLLDNFMDIMKHH